MRLLFILKESNTNERLGVMYLSSALKSLGHEVKLILAESFGLRRLKRFVKSYSPKIIGYSVMTGEHMKLLEINRYLKECHDFLAVFGGPHATFFPTLINEEGCDAICVGEGDLAFPEFCRKVARNQAYWKTSNFIVKHEERIYQNPPMPLVEDLDQLPFPDRDLMYEADPGLTEGSKKVFIATRGCPYKCSYCFNKKYNELYDGNGKIIRHRSPKNLIDEISKLQELYTLDVVEICDDTFLIKPEDWFKEFSMLYKERIRRPFYCNVRPNLVTEEKVSLLRKTGLDAVSIGVECIDEKIANTVLNRNITNEQIKNACRILKKYDIKIITANLVALPVPNSFQTDLQTLDFNIKLRPTFAWSSIVSPYPGTAIESYARTHGFLTGKPVFLETNKRSSAFNFSSPSEKRKVENLHKLFGLIVEFPFLRRLTVFLCSLRLSTLYTALFYFLYGYKFKMRIWPFRSMRKELGKYIHYWWNLVFKT